MRTFKRTRKAPVLAGVIVLTWLLAACGQLAPTSAINDFLINEVYLGTGGSSLQWIEIIDNSESGATDSLAGWTLVTSKGSIDLGTLRGTAVGPAPARALTTFGPDKPQIPAGNYLVITSNPSEFNTRYSERLPKGFTVLDGTNILGSLNPRGDAIALKKGTDVVDQLGWGEANSQTRAQLGFSNDVNLALPAVTEEGKTLGRTPAVGARDPKFPGPFTMHDTASPAEIVPQPPNRYNSNFFISTATDYIGIGGGLLLWGVFIMIALIAQRFQELARQPTYWRWLLIAPIGILIYDAVTMYAFSFTPTRSYGAIPEWRNFAFVALFLSGIACLYVVNIFRLIAKNILEAE